MTVCTTNALDQQKNLLIKNRKRVLNGVEVYYFRNILRFGKIFFSPETATFLRKNLKEFDVVHLHEYRKSQNIIAHYYAQKYSVPYIVQPHGSLPMFIAKRKLKWLYDAFFGNRLLRDAAKVVALSELEVQQLKVMGLPEEKIEIIPNGIDLEEYVDLPPKGSFKRKYSISDETKLILYLGRIHESKGLAILLDAFCIVKRRLANVMLVIVGPDDGYATVFLKLVTDLKLRENVLFTGFVEDSIRLSALADSDTLVTPLFSGFPVTFLEACFTGCPIVTTSEELDWIHDNVGYVSQKSSISLAEAILNILQDKGISEQFQSNCKKMIKNFDISRITSQLENTYKSVLQ